MYGKIFQQTFTGSMFGAGSDLFAVWSYIIAHADKTHMVELNPEMLSPIIGCSVATVIYTIEKLCEPDPKSRNKEHEGKRLIKQGEYLYFVTGHERWRNCYSNEERKEYMRTYMAKRREEERKQLTVNMSKQALANVKVGDNASVLVHGTVPVPSKSRCTEKEAEDFTESLGLPRSDGRAMFLHWQEKGWAKIKDWKLTIRNWREWGYLPSQKAVRRGPTRSMSAFEIEKRQKAIADEINALWKANVIEEPNGNKSLPKGVRDKIDELKTRRNELKKMMTQ